MPGGVSKPIARPFALDMTTLADNALEGRLARAVKSLLLLESAAKALIYALQVMG